MAQGKYAVLDHPAGHQVINPYGVASTPKDIFTVTAEDEAEERKLRAKYQGGTNSRFGRPTSDDLRREDGQNIIVSGHRRAPVLAQGRP